MQRTPAIIIALTRLYDYHKQELCSVLSGGQVPLSDSRLKDKVNFLREIAATLSTVMQVEKLRSKEPNPDVKLPDEQINLKDPALDHTRKGSHAPPNIKPTAELDNFPGGWQP